MKKRILIISIFSIMMLPLLCSCKSEKEKAIEIVKEGYIEEYPSIKIKDAVSTAILSPECSAVESLDNWLVTFKGIINTSILDGAFEDLDALEVAYTFSVDLSTKKISVDNFVFAGKKINSNNDNFEDRKTILLGILFNDEKMFDNLFTNTSCFSPVSISEEYVSGQREIFDWYTNLGLINLESCDETPAEIRIECALACKKDDKTTYQRIDENVEKIRTLIKDFLKTKTANELRDCSNETKIANEIKNLINDNFDDFRIRDVEFLQKDVF